MQTSHRKMFSLPGTGLVAVVMLAAACAGGDAGSAASTTVERDTIGDTVVVRTTAGSIWGDSAQLVEELRIGELDGPDEYTFGQVREFAVGPQGTIYTYDGAVKALRAYDSTGRYLRTIGGAGGGPGEYGEVVGLAVLPDGRLLQRDPRQGRIVSYSADGDPLAAWPIKGGLFASNALTTDRASLIYSKILTGDIRTGEPWPLGYVVMDTTGAVVDTVHAPIWPQQPGNPTYYDPVSIWSWDPDGFLVAAFGARYAVELRRPGQPWLRIERAGQPRISVSAAERDELTRRVVDRRMQRTSANQGAQPTVPSEKPFIRDLAVGSDGRIWVRPHMPSVERPEEVDTTLSPSNRPTRWIEPEVWDVFEPDGSFLGRLHFPPRSTVFARRGDKAWGTVRDENDVPYIVRWRVETGGDGVNR